MPAAAQMRERRVMPVVTEVCKVWPCISYDATTNSKELTPLSSHTRIILLSDLREVYSKTRPR
jgi:hypothetical protein